MFVLRKTMDAAIQAEREKAAKERYAFYRQYGDALDRVTALQKQLSAWVLNDPENITPEQMAQMFYAQDDDWQARFFNVMQEQVQAHHDALPADTVWGKCPGVPAGEAQWYHMAKHLDDSGFETIEAMFDHAKYAREQVAA